MFSVIYLLKLFSASMPVKMLLQNENDPGEMDLRTLKLETNFSK